MSIERSFVLPMEIDLFNIEAPYTSDIFRTKSGKLRSRKLRPEEIEVLRRRVYEERISQIKDQAESERRERAAKLEEERILTDFETDVLMRLHRRRQQLMCAYGITLDRWNKILESQGYRCAICKRKPDKGKKWHTDHCHRTRKVCGILCSDCNAGIGFLKESPDVLVSAAEYLIKSKKKSKLKATII
jgi:transposase